MKCRACGKSPRKRGDFCMSCAKRLVMIDAAQDRDTRIATSYARRFLEYGLK